METFLKQGAVQTPAIAATMVSGAINASAAVVLAADDTTRHVDEVRVDVTYTGGAVGEAVNIHIAEGNTAGEYDGGVTPSAAGDSASLPNLGVPVPIVSQTGSAFTTRGSAVFRVTKARLCVVAHNAGSLSDIAGFTVKVTPLSYVNE